MHKQHGKYSSNALDAHRAAGLKWSGLSLNRIDFNFYRSILHTPLANCGSGLAREEAVSFTITGA
jgi:hypothetical protein